ncbi:MAG: major facilitator superfamily domain-containing protein 6 [Gemmatimonadota bacterium]
MGDSHSSGRPVVLAGGFYLLYYAAMAALLPYLTLYYQQLGLRGGQIGVLVAIPPVLTLFGASLWGAAADATRRHRLVLCLAIAGAAVAALALSRVGAFGWLVPTVVVFAFFVAPITALADNAVMELLGDRRDRYGRVRLWGAVGWGVAAPLVGRLVEQRGLGLSFYAYAALMLACLLVAARLPVAAGHRAVLGQGLRRLLGNRQWRLFLFLAFVGGAGLGFVHHFLFLYMEQIGASRTTMGLALTTATLSELVFFYCADRWVRRYGVRPLFIAAMLASSVRLFAYSVTDAPWVVLVIQLLHGPSFAMMWTAGVSWANRLAPPGLGATAQGLFTGVNFGLAGAAGALVGGVLFEHLGPVPMYRIASLGVLAGAVVYLLAGRRGDTPSMEADHARSESQSVVG